MTSGGKSLIFNDRWRPFRPQPISPRHRGEPCALCGRAFSPGEPRSHLRICGCLPRPFNPAQRFFGLRMTNVFGHPRQPHPSPSPSTEAPKSLQRYNRIDFAPKPPVRRARFEVETQPVTFAEMRRGFSFPLQVARLTLDPRRLCNRPIRGHSALYIPSRKS